MIRQEEDQYICDGMCFEQERVLNEIFTLWGAWFTTGDPMGVVKESVNIKEISRSLSIISLQCRQQMTSYFSEALRKANAVSEADKHKYLEAAYPIATNVLKSSVGSMVCDKTDKLLPLSFYSMINKFCHVEEWKYPCSFWTIGDADNRVIPHSNGHLILGTDEDDQQRQLCNKAANHCLEVKVTKQGQSKGGERIVPASNQYDTCRIFIPTFANAARIFITECESCQLEEISPDLEQECPV